MITAQRDEKNTEGRGEGRKELLVVPETVNDVINARGVYLVLGVQAGAFNRKEAFIL